jgi:hypothetical protein
MPAYELYYGGRFSRKRTGQRVVAQDISRCYPHALGGQNPRVAFFPHERQNREFQRYQPIHHRLANKPGGAGNEDPVFQRRNPVMRPVC